MSPKVADPARPLRAIVAVLTIWVTGRSAFLIASAVAEAQTVIPTDAARLPTAVAAFQPPRADRTSITKPSAIWPTPSRIVVSPKVSGDKRSQRVSLRLAHDRTFSPLSVGARVMPTERTDFATTESKDAGPTQRPRSPALLRAASSGWSGTFWLAARDGSAPRLGSDGGQLGGSQTGVRVYRQLTPTVSLTARASTALSSRQAEASAGVALRHGAIALLAERRFALDRGGRNDWSLTAVAGVDDIALPHGFRLDGYAQAGVVGRDGFADGAVRIERTVLAPGRSRLSLGAGSWGSVQPGASRLDIGPQVVARVSPAGHPLRLSAEWRQRVAGNARPGSGPAVTLGADF